MKTAGTMGFEKFLSNPKQMTMNGDMFPPFPECPVYISRWRGERVGAIHCTHSELQLCMNASDVKFITTIRNPIDRVISEYFWIEGAPMWTLSMVDFKSQGKMHEWVADPTNTAHNKQAFQILFEAETFPSHRYDECAMKNATKTLQWREKIKSETVESLQRRLVDIVEEKFSFVIVKERLKETEVVFSSMFPHVEIQKDVAHSHSTIKLEISQEIRDKIESRNQLDLFLYSYIETKLVHKYNNLMKRHMMH